VEEGGGGDGSRDARWDKVMWVSRIGDKGSPWKRIR
jgi:hypothetical protein